MEYWITGCSILDARYWILVAGYWIFDELKVQSSKLKV
ncbi:hypothetical protein D3OALGA1CA_5197 [Olavius algarvensis associated proteobacterium Delta 3]|nr:hypothetical protein D3OALGA1CA_5197 [Olavius algarvensis associated proteobacterium Delta 3]